MQYKFGRVSYINSLPLFCAGFKMDCEIVKDYPARLNEMCRAGALDLSLISLWGYAGIKDSYKILPEFCIAGDGAVKSVLLFSKYPIEALKGKKIYLSRESKSSVSAFAALCIDKFGFDPRKTQSARVADADAVFLIGNPALAFDGAAYPCFYDFGALWKEHFKQPIIYAVCVVKNAYFDALKDGLGASFEQSLKNFEADKKRLCASAAKEFENSAMTPTDVEAYYDSLIYRLGAGAFEKSIELAKKYGAF